MKKMVLAMAITAALTGNTFAANNDIVGTDSPKAGNDPKQESSVWMGNKVIDELVIDTNGKISGDPANGISNDFTEMVDLVTEAELKEVVSDLAVGNVGNIGSGSFAGQSENDFDVEMGDVAGNVGNICSGTATGNAVINCEVEIENANIENANVSFEDLTDEQKEQLKGQDGAKGEKGEDGKDGKDGTQVSVSAGGVSNPTKPENNEFESQLQLNGNTVLENKLTGDGVLSMGTGHNEVTGEFEGIKVDLVTEAELAGKLDDITDGLATEEQLGQVQDDVEDLLGEVIANDGDIKDLQDSVVNVNDKVNSVEEDMNNKINAVTDYVDAKDRAVLELAKAAAANGDEETFNKALEALQSGDAAVKAELAEQLQSGLDSAYDYTQVIGKWAVDTAREYDEAIKNHSDSEDAKLQEQINGLGDTTTELGNKVEDAIASGQEADKNLQDQIDTNKATSDAKDAELETALGHTNDRIDTTNSKVSELQGDLQEVGLEVLSNKETISKLEDSVEYITEVNGYQSEQIEALENGLSKEVSDREAADKEIVKQANEDRAASQAADKQLQENIDAEEAARKAADAEIVAQADTDREASQKADAKIVADQSIVDAKQDKVFSDYRVVQERIDAGQTMQIDELYQLSGDMRSDITNLEQRMDNVEVEIAGIHTDIKRLDGMMAANAAANSIVVPRNFDGGFSVGIGVGAYRNQAGLAIGVLHDGGDYAIKATVAGTNADNWNDLQYGASVNFTTNFFK